MSLLSIGLTGLNAAQAGLSTTGHNITNASTDGYNRQRVVQSTLDPLFSGTGFFGQGTSVQDVQRIYSQFLVSQVRSADTAHSDYEVYSNEISQIDNLLADETAGLSPVVQDLFKGIQQVASSPGSIPARQAMLSSSAALVDRFHTLNERLTEIRSGVDSQMSSTTEAINSLATEIANLNLRIKNTEAAGGVQANDLHDQRDKLIGQLNQQVRVSTLTQSDGSINVFFGSGQPLVLGASTYQLTTGPSPTNPEDLAIYSTLGGASVLIPDDLVTGGTLGGLMRFRNDALNTATNELGRLAVTIAKNFNDQHALGQDLDGNLGGLYFNTLSPDVVQTSGTGTASMTASFLQAQDLKAEDYTLSFATATGYTLRRNSDGTTVYNGATPPDGTTTDPTNTDKTIRYGFNISITGAPANGDTWLISPTRKAASDISLAIQDVRKIAAAAPFTTAADLGNAGTGKIGSGAAVSTTGFGSPPAFNAITLTFNSATNTFVARTSTGAAVTLLVRTPASSTDPLDPAVPSGTTAADNTYDPVLDAGGKTFEIGSPAMRFTISGSPQNGDVFRLDLNTSGISDNRNALALGQLQNAKSMLNGGASYEYAYSQMVSDVGTLSRNANIGLDAQKALLDQATTSQQSLSGVNLDEEAANLLRYQQAYQAAARVMSTASKLFDTILNL